MSYRVPESLQRAVVEVEGWIDLGNPGRALDKVGPLLEHPGSRPAGIALEIRAFVELERFAEALELLSELRTLPHDAEWLAVTEGWCRRRMDDLSGAARCMRRLISTRRSSAIGHYNLACYLALLGQRDEACAMLAHAIALDTAFRTMARSEEDFRCLEKDRRFRALVDPIT